MKCPHCGEIITTEIDESKESKIKRLQQKFYDSLIEFVDEFGSEMVRDFYEYWSEPNRSRTKIKYQLEKTWDTKKRLQRWSRNNFNNEKNRQSNNKGFASDSTQRTIESTINTLREESQ
jgi:hypothetical protein